MQLAMSVEFSREEFITCDHEGLTLQGYPASVGGGRMHRRHHRPHLHLQPHLRPLKTLRARAAAGESDNSIACAQFWEQEKIKNKTRLCAGRVKSSDSCSCRFALCPASICAWAASRKA